jgi:hypothetical protein
METFTFQSKLNKLCKFYRFYWTQQFNFLFIY